MFFVLIVCSMTLLATRRRVGRVVGVELVAVVVGSSRVGGVVRVGLVGVMVGRIYAVGHGWFL
jgi:hypothetical protein